MRRRLIVFGRWVKGEVQHPQGQFASCYFEGAFAVDPPRITFNLGFNQGTGRLGALFNRLVGERIKDLKNLAIDFYGIGNENLASGHHSQHAADRLR